jgi:hypothetical protein
VDLEELGARAAPGAPEDRQVAPEAQGVQDFPGSPDNPDLPSLVSDLVAVVEELRSEVAGERDDRRRSVRRVIVSVAASGALVITGFVAGILVAYDHIDVRVDANTAQIARTQYELCLGQRADALRQNALIDNAIVAERRKLVPDPRRIKDLVDFRNTVPACGPAQTGG